MVCKVSFSRLFQTFCSEKDIDFPDIHLKCILIFQTRKPIVCQFFTQIFMLLRISIVFYSRADKKFFSTPTTLLSVFIRGIIRETEAHIKHEMSDNRIPDILPPLPCFSYFLYGNLQEQIGPVDIIFVEIHFVRLLQVTLHKNNPK